ncbi:P-type DNA transfer ATPase VirB11 [Aliirhizobium smilacinae]|uniref:Type IV secretion system protein n=1 Tax=Aliirhizobium smilacinae TaxID=1395944 RepID=A0A5C4XQS9_9HYPH|nr:P-type DNA transfer ATPase VirB11 [Rhizobium smilacinae]TNM65311.1 P-type DNA transfer ATPase VirB11 [Rhizobium smilacinae]
MNVRANEDGRHNSLYFLHRALLPLQPFLDDPQVIEIAINQPGLVFTERLGVDGMERHHIPELSGEEIRNIGERIAALTQQFVSAAKPLLSASLPGGERVQCILPPAAPDGGAVSIRKQVVSDYSLADLRNAGAFDDFVGGLPQNGRVEDQLRQHLEAGRIYEFIDLALAKRISMLISGGTSSGKTTFLNACFKNMDQSERIITIEDTRELFPPHENAVHLVASKGDQGTADVTIQSLLEASLRMRPDRLFVGEIRGSEAFSFLRAINTGHPGSVSTVHADTPLGAYEQLIMMMMQSGMVSGFSKADLASYIKTVIPIVIQLKRDGGRRGVSDIFFCGTRQ